MTSPPSICDRPILVTAAHGKTGRRVASRLTAAGHAVRAGSRSGDPRFDWTDPTTWPGAVDSVRAAYLAYQPDLALPGAREAVTGVAAALVERGVQRAVLLSGRGEPLAQECEHAFLDLIPTGTVVRCAFFHQNFSEGAFAQTVIEGVLALPGAPERGEPFVDAEDIADVIVAALTASHAEYQGRVLELTGPRVVPLAEAAGILGDAFGRPVKYHQVTGPEFAAGAESMGLPADEAQGLADVFVDLFDGRNSATTSTVADVLGRPARSLEDFAAAAAAGGAWSRA
ncbi:NmrA family transcriptional regulator [Ruania halotolerans]|uniref:NmrA family transcriptional regulator n=1 Tax=Ruania halotolerans TaxID=2897773 RepID=UPI001E41DB58|nr:NmrA family transcriptional regulator [Ruania halotolerans]UFU05952.1 NmrA family transcriptional regulator [Ruania halotolerans]